MKQQKTNNVMSAIREARAKAMLTLFQAWPNTELNHEAYKLFAERGFTKSHIHQAIDDLCADQLLEVGSDHDGYLRVKCLS